MKRPVPVRLAILLLIAALAGVAQAPGTGVARVVKLKGTLTLSRAQQGSKSLRLHDTVAPGDQLITGPDSEAVIQTSDGATVRVFPDSRVVFTNRAPGIEEFLHLFLGSIKVHVEKISGRPNPHEVTTPTAVIAVRGTTFSVFVDETNSTLVAVDDGEVAVANVQTPGTEVILHRGQRSWVRPGQPPAQAQRFRGHSEHADMDPAQGQGHGMFDSGDDGPGGHGGMGQGQGVGMGRGMGGMTGRGRKH